MSSAIRSWEQQDPPRAPWIFGTCCAHGRSPAGESPLDEYGSCDEVADDVRIGVPRELKNNEYRVAITPAGAHEFIRHGHDVAIEAGAGLGSAIPDEEYVAAGAKICESADDVWSGADLVLKVKEPIAAEYHRM